VPNLKKTKFTSDEYVTQKIDCGIKKGDHMKTEKGNWSTIAYVSAFLIGVILFWSFGKDWLDLESASIFLAGLIGVAVAVLTFWAWNVRHNSHHKGN
jgi:SNF family Na+-dependent transporter